MINMPKHIANVIHNQGRCPLGTYPEDTEENKFCSEKCPLRKEVFSCKWEEAYRLALKYVNKSKGKKRQELLKELL